MAILNPLDRILGVASTLAALQALSRHSADEDIKVEGDGFCTLFRLLGNELDEAAGDLVMQLPTRP